MKNKYSKAKGFWMLTLSMIFIIPLNAQRVYDNYNGIQDPVQAKKAYTQNNRALSSVSTGLIYENYKGITDLAQAKLAYLADQNTNQSAGLDGGSNQVPTLNTPPPNDLCGGAVSISCGNAVSGSTIDATGDMIGSPFCGVSITTPGVWYSFVATDKFGTISTCNSASFDTKISLFTGDCNNLVCVDGNDDGSGCAGFTSELDFTAIVGNTYYVYVHGFGVSTGTFTLSLHSCFTPPANDECSGATPISFGTITDDNCTAYSDQVTPECNVGNSDGKGLWYSVQGNGNDFNANTCNSLFDTRIRVYEGSCTNLVCVVDNDDSDDCSPGSYQSSVDWTSTSGTTYYILVDGYDEFECGSFDLNLSQTVNCTVDISESNLSGFCQGGVKLTANATDPGTYLWSTGDTTESILVVTSGIYSVTATSPSSCVSSASYTVTVTAEDLLSAYTIVAMKEAHLHGYNTVLNGGVGVMNTDGKGKAHENSMLTASTTFMKAPIIEINKGSVVTNQIVGTPSITLPTFLYLPAGTKDTTIAENTTAILSGSAYKKVQVKKGATVTFTEANISFHELKFDDNATVAFSGCANLYIEKKMEMKKYSVFNAANHEVILYAKDKVEIKEGSVFNGNVYAQGDIKAKGKEAKAARVHKDHTHPAEPAIPTYMNGMFIGNKVHGDKNVIWNWDTNCGNSCTPTGTSTTSKKATEMSITTETLAVTSYPNPFSYSFNIELTTTSDSPITIEIYNLAGMLVEKHTNIEYDEFVEYGQSLKDGMYIVTISQDGKTNFIKVIKSN